MQDTGRDTAFEELSKQNLADTLRVFYSSVRQKNGEVYQKQSLTNIRSSLNRHLSLPPFNGSWDLMHDAEFKAANRVFTGNIRLQKEQGLDKSSHRTPVSQEHMQQIYDNYFVPHWSNDPKCLQHKIFFDLVYFMGRRGKEKLRELKKEWFVFKKDGAGAEYVELIINEATKKSKGDDNNELKDKSVMFAQKDPDRCPVYTMKFYLSKLTDLPWLFQQPNPNYRLPKDRWYKKSPVGINMIGKYLSEISEKAGLSARYTNHCIRSSTVNAMKKGKHQAIEIAHHIKQKNVNSLESYMKRPTLKDKKKYAKSLSKYVEEPPSNSDESSEASDAEDFDPQPPKKSKKKKVTSTVSKPPETSNTDGDRQIVPLAEITNNDNNAQVAMPSSSQNNYLSMFKQNPVGMFVGANLNNCTININMPK